MDLRHYNFLDQALIGVNDFLTTLFAEPSQSRKNPADFLNEEPLTDKEKNHSAALMRVNHTGEVCAQALYQGQMVVARNDQTKKMLKKAHEEEMDHLSWTQQRIHELQGRTSFLNPFWYSGAFLFGVMASLAGDKWSLGFVEETERQVALHLMDHLDRLPLNDNKSRIIIEQMHEDEKHHGHCAQQAGAVDLPQIIKFFMVCHAKIMTTIVYWL